MRRSHLFAMMAALACSPATRAADADPLLPAETEQVLFVNVKQMLDSDVLKTLLMPKIEEAMKRDEVKALTEALGLDPLKDIGSLTAGAWGNDPRDMKLVAVLRGKFDGDKLLKTAEEVAKMAGDKLSLVEEGDFKMVKVLVEGNTPVFASVADGKTLVLSTDKKVLAASLTAHKTAAKAVLGKELTALVAKQDGKASLFLCGLVKGKLDDLPIPDDLAPLPIKGDDLRKQLAAMTDLSITLRADKDATVDLTTGMKDETAATAFGKTVKQMLPLAKGGLSFYALSKKEFQPLAADVAKSLDSKTAKTDTSIGVTVTADAIGSLLAGGEKKKK